MTVERREADGSIVVRDEDGDGVMLTPAGGGAVIVVSGARGMHPLDTIPALLGAPAAHELRDALDELLAR
jgi:hypothetical protein